MSPALYWGSQLSLGRRLAQGYLDLDLPAIEDVHHATYATLVFPCHELSWLIGVVPESASIATSTTSCYLRTTKGSISLEITVATERNPQSA